MNEDESCVSGSPPATSSNRKISVNLRRNTNFTNLLTAPFTLFSDNTSTTTMKKTKCVNSNYFVAVNKPVDSVILSDIV